MARRRWWHLLPWETQRRLVYDDRPDEPRATCHLQVTEEQDALCGFQWDGLVIVPGDPGWTDLHPSLGCDGCSRAAGVTDEDPAGRSFRHQW